MDPANTRLGGLVLDVLETWYGCWFTDEQLISAVCEIRPNADPDSVLRAVRRLRAQGWGKAADRIIITTSSGGMRRRCRQLNVELKQSSSGLCAMRVTDRDYLR